MIWFCIAITLLLLWNAALTFVLYRTMRTVAMLLCTSNSLTVTVWRLVMVLSNQELDDDNPDAPPDSIDDLLKGGVDD